MLFSQSIRWLLVSLMVSKLLISPCPLFLLEILLTFILASKLLAFLSKSAPSSSSWFVCVITKYKIQNTEVMDITDTIHSLLLIPEELMQRHIWSLRKTRGATVPILTLTSMSGMNSKSSFFFCKTCVEKANNKIWHSVILSHIHLLIIFANVLTPQPTEQFCLYCSSTYGEHCMCVCLVWALFAMHLFFPCPSSANHCVWSVGS